MRFQISFLALCLGLNGTMACAQALDDETAGDGSVAASSGETTLLETIIATAGRRESEVANVAQNVNVIERDEIERLTVGSEDAANLVSRLVPGYQPDNQTISGASESYRGRSILILVDGVPRTTPLRNNTRILSLIDLDTIERVEVVSGASSLYGAGATGGVINFITKRGEDETPRWTVETRVEAQTADLADSASPSTTVSVEGRKGDFDYFLSASGDWSRRLYDGNGDEMASDGLLGQGGGDRTGVGNLFGRFGYEVDSRRFDLSFDWTYAEQRPGYYTDYSGSRVRPDYSDPYDGEPLVEDSKYVTARYTDDAFALGGLELTAFYNDIEKQSPETQLSAVNSSVLLTGLNQTVLEGQRFGLGATVRTPTDRIFEGSELVWGTDYTYDYITQQQVGSEDDVAAPLSQHQLGLFSQAEVPVHDRLRLSGGVRFDAFWLEVEDFTRPAYTVDGFAIPLPAIDVGGGNFDYQQFTFNAGAVFDVTEDAQLYGNFSQGYALADIGAFTRRAGVNGGFFGAEFCDAYAAFCGSPPSDLYISYADIAPEPQLVNTFEGGVRGDWGRFRASASAFISLSENGLTYDASTNTVTQQKERIWGGELTTAFDVTDAFTVGGTLGYVDGEYDSDGDGDIDEDLPNNRIATTWKGNLFASYAFANGIDTRADLEFFSGRDRLQDDEIDGAALLHLSAQKTFENGHKLSLGVYNVFDTDYANPTATATRGTEVPGLGRTVAFSYKAVF
ncbi:TonB-dependent receptor [Notoacmeibacter sp. MSK16QG-6]|uniref:TonB-dependent receptor n=1 Tax=Notoacmeibacter sp. MSK16QG-6 TaxID=2957982 RepID=UPI00209E963D|nr:TonB-dependent receptor [Notoacmeibacter sp. MSK16QG-6]MCP1198306.1 TonB-dependent receptor [Notoacmeibacter sp. MSK16QG-6]